MRGAMFPLCPGGGMLFVLRGEGACRQGSCGKKACELCDDDDNSIKLACARRYTHHFVTCLEMACNR